MALFEINEKSRIPIWLQLKNRFIYLITSGYYKPCLLYTSRCV